jgi:hypothetical protein
LFEAVDSLIEDCGPWLALQLDIEVFRTAAQVVEKIQMGEGLRSSSLILYFRRVERSFILDLKPRFQVEKVGK